MADLFLPTDKIYIMGMSGCGKSTLARTIQESFPRKVVFDTLREYEGEDHIVTESYEGFSRGIVWAFENTPERFSVIYRFPLGDEDVLSDFNETLGVLYKQGDLQIVVEEVQNFASAHYVSYWLKQAILTGRHQKISVMMTTQRPGEAHKTTVSQCNHFFFGRMWERNDLEYARSVIRERSQELSNIPLYRFLWFRPGRPIIMVDNHLKPISQSRDTVPKVEPPTPIMENEQ